MHIAAMAGSRSHAAQRPDSALEVTELEDCSDFVQARQGASGSCARPSHAMAMLGDPRMHNPYGGTVKRLVSNTQPDSAGNSPRAVAQTSRAVAALRAMLDLTTRGGPGDPPSFQPRCISGNLLVLTQRWANPLPAVALLVEYGGLPSPACTQAFFTWLAQHHPDKAAKYGSALASTLRATSPAYQAYLRHVAHPKPSVGSLRPQLTQPSTGGMLQP